jgi:peptide chain release factor 1
MEDLSAVYARYALLNGFKIEILSSYDSHTSLEIVGLGVGNAFRFETGHHCIQHRAKSGKGKPHTSLVAVGVLPLPPKHSQAPLKDADLETIFQCGHGSGGQHQNKTASAVRMLHKPTGLKVFINGRNQWRNLDDARRILTARVNDLMKGHVEADYSKIRKEQVGNGSRGTKVRTYNFMRSEVVDHRLGTKTSNIKEVMKGHLELIWQA